MNKNSNNPYSLTNGQSTVQQEIESITLYLTSSLFQSAHHS